MALALRSRRWVFTAYNGLDWLKQAYEGQLSANVKFIQFSLEKCPSTGRIHAQGYVELRNAAAGSTFQKYFKPCGEIHVDVAKGDQASNLKYTSKEESHVEGPFKWGTPAKQGDRKDLEELADMVKEGASMAKVIDANPGAYVRYHRGLRALEEHYLKPLDRGEPVIYYLHGDPACGKSAVVRELIKLSHGSDFYKVIEQKEGWFHNYRGESAVLFEEFAGVYPLPLLLQVLDRGVCNLPTKGGTTNLRATHFYFTSNFAPHELYTHAQNQAAWLSRLDGYRFEEVYVSSTEEVKQLYRAFFGRLPSEQPGAGRKSVLDGLELILKRKAEALESSEGLEATEVDAPVLPSTSVFNTEVSP